MKIVRSVLAYLAFAIACVGLGVFAVAMYASSGPLP